MSAVKRVAKKQNKNKEVWLKQLGSRIKELRLKANMSQADLAYAIQMDAQNISRIERGLINPSAYSIKLISEALEITVVQLYSSLNN